SAATLGCAPTRLALRIAEPGASRHRSAGWLQDGEGSRRATHQIEPGIKNCASMSGLAFLPVVLFFQRNIFNLIKESFMRLYVTGGTGLVGSNVIKVAQE